MLVVAEWMLGLNIDSGNVEDEKDQKRDTAVYILTSRVQGVQGNGERIRKKKIKPSKSGDAKNNKRGKVRRRVAPGGSSGYATRVVESRSRAGFPEGIIMSQGIVHIGCRPKQSSLRRL